MSTIQVEERLAADGFPELERHWRKFLTLTPDGKPFLYVDGVEGSNAIAPQAVHQALLQFAFDHQIDAVFYNEYPYNRIPQRMIRNIRD